MLGDWTGATARSRVGRRRKRIMSATPTRLRLACGMASLLMLGGLAACSEPHRATGQSEQAIHADVGSTRPKVVGAHHFSCEGGAMLYIDFVDAGLGLEIRKAPDAPPMRLTAPEQGAAFVAPGAHAVMRQQALDLTEAGGRHYRCRRMSPR